MDPENEASQSEPARTVEPHRGTLILTLGILGLVLCAPLGVIAWVMAEGDLRRMRDGQMDPSGWRQTSSGRVCGIVASLLLVVSLFLGWFLLRYLQSFLQQYLSAMG